MRTISLSAALALCTLLLACGKAEKKPDPGTQGAQKTSPQDSLTITLDGADSTTVFELLTYDHEVDYQSSAMGVFVQGIDSVFSNSEYFWVYSVNDTMAQTAADKFVTSDGDRVIWHFRKLGQ